MKTTRKFMRYLGGTYYTALLLAVGLLAAPMTALAQPRIKLDRPDQRQYVVDQANFLDDQQAEEIQRICEKLLNDRATPLILVSVDSMAAHGGAGMTIESFSATLFDEWGIGHERLGARDWNTGVLLLLSRDDRKAHIEFGRGWQHRYDAVAERIMSEEIVPRCKQGDFAGAMIAATRRLDALVREAVPNPNQVAPNQRPQIKEPVYHHTVATGPSHFLESPEKWTLWQWAGIVLGSILLGLSLYSVFTEGPRGWGFFFWAFAFRMLMWIAIMLILKGGRGRRHSSSGFFGGGGSSGGGSFGGGSFGGGSSGGGGASGSW